MTHLAWVRTDEIEYAGTDMVVICRRSPSKIGVEIRRTDGLGYLAASDNQVRELRAALGAFLRFVDGDSTEGEAA